MFAKTYRVHRIFTYSGIGLCKDKILQDSKLILLVCALLVIDGLVVTLWVVTDPLDRHLSNLTLEISAIDRSVVYQPQVSQVSLCHSINLLGDFFFASHLRTTHWRTIYISIWSVNGWTTSVIRFAFKCIYSRTSASVLLRWNTWAKPRTLSPNLSMTLNFCVLSGNQIMESITFFDKPIKVFP